MRNKHVAATGKKPALESDDVKLVAPENEDTRPLEPEQTDTTKTNLSAGTPEVEVKPFDTEDDRPLEPVTEDNAGSLSDGTPEIEVKPFPSEDDRPVDGAIEGEAEGPLEGVEFDIIKSLDETHTEVEDFFELRQGQEVLENYAEQINHLLKTKTCSPQTAQIMRSAVNHQLRNVSVAVECISLESHSKPLSVEDQHKKILTDIALESEASRRLGQTYVMQFKHGMNAVSDFFRGIAGQVKKYEGKLEAAHREFSAAKPKFKSDKHTGFLTELWYHFSNENGPIKTNMLGAIEHDLALTQYILNEYAPAVMQQAVKITNICKSGDLSTPEGILKVNAALEQLKHPADMFDMKYIKGQSYLSVTHLDIDKKKTRQPIEAGGKTLEKLAYLASPKKVVEIGSNKHTAKKIAAYIASVGSAAIPIPGSSIATAGAGGVIAGSFTMTTSEIEKVFVHGKHYLELVKHFLQNENHLEQVGANMDEAVNKLAATAKDAAGKKVAGQIRDISYATLMYNYNSPAREEVARAIKGAKYCGYLGLRMIHNAKRTKADKS